jgi:hypothetical protein
MWKAGVNPITKAGRKLILDTVLRTLAEWPPEDDAKPW